MSSTSGSNRSYKRFRTGQIEEPDPDNVRSAVSALLERLASIRQKAESTRDEHISTIKEIDERIAAKQTAMRAAARVGVPSCDNETIKYARGVIEKSAEKKVAFVGKPTISPTKLLMESDPPEKVIHEQSIIVRAQSISRKNAELARERLPKQPEAQRNKTYWDYLLDEAVWLSTDFREERKWKVHMAKRLSRAVVAYHVQKEQRAERAAKAENLRIRRTANSLARDVRKFWSQIREIADLRAKEIDDIRLQEKRNHQLQEVLEEAGNLASALSASYMEESNGLSRSKSPKMLGSSAVVNAPKILDRKNESRSLQHDSPTVSIANRSQEALYLDEVDTSDGDFSSCSESYMNGVPIIEDDETTMDIAEAEDGGDPHETLKLEAEATMSLEDLLRSRGIDPDSYRAQIERNVASPSKSDANANGLSVSQESNMDSEEALERTVPRISGYSVVKDSSAHNIGESPPRSGFVSRFPGTSSARADTGSNVTNWPTTSGCRAQPEVQVSRQIRHPAEHGSQVLAPRLLRGSLRSYQLAGVQWLVALYKKNVNGILADEMGLGKTIQTIALLAWLALEKGIWGPHLIVVPTSVMVNWEVELKKWLPAFKVLTYFGTQKERKAKRVGWTRPDSFHVCITSYTLVVQDAASLRRKEWVYLILDEAHNIKNFQSQRWQVLLRFPSARRLLLTGTPLQNSVMELWSLLHFLMPAMFESQAEFKDWFYTPISKVAKENEAEDTKQMVSKLHEVLRPFLLRRLKRDVEKSLRPKVEHVLKCPLSKRQRQLYEDFLARSETQNTLESGDFFGVMGVLMQLRKVCNHPDLFESRPILSPFSMKPLFYPLPSLVMVINPSTIRADLSLLSLDLATEESRGWPGYWHLRETQRLSAVTLIAQDCENEDLQTDTTLPQITAHRLACSRRATLRHHAQLTSYKVRKRALLGQDKIFAASMTPRGFVRHGIGQKDALPNSYLIARPIELVVALGNRLFDRFVCCIRKVDAPSVELRFLGDDSYRFRSRAFYRELAVRSSPLRLMFRVAHVRSSVTLPDSRLVQWDCGKLQVLARLLRVLKNRSSRALIYSQMSKVLNILESFLNLHGIRYLRLDGATRTGERQRIVERFNTDSRIFCMILTTRAGGVGLNLTGADTVIFYDTDYNPAIDAQAQDRVHRIGQKKTVHIYRLVSEKTVEENILKRANEKRSLESVVISQAGFNIDSIRKRAGVDELVNDRGNGSMDLMASLRKSTSSHSKGLRLDTFEKLVRKSGTSNSEDSKKVPILSSYGTVKPLLWVDREATHRKPPDDIKQSENDEKSTQKLAEDSDLYNTLLEDEEETNMILKSDDPADDFAESEEGETSPKAVKLCRSSDRISSALTPVQLFALKFVERGESIFADQSSGISVPGPDNNIVTQGDCVGLSVVDCNPVAVVDHDCSPLFYEQTIIPNAYPSSLKVLTDSDANIKIYLPLRDGGPEELKISTVVNGTAAAGLECAEDAAFFPHAYNRMSRTAHATKRQKERLANNLRRREEIEAKKLRDAKFASVQRAAAQRLAGQVQVPSDSRSRNGGTKLRDDIGHPPTKRLRTDSSGANISSNDGGLFPGTNGLFKKNVKRNQRKASSRYNKSSLSSSSASLQMGEGVGKNDRWTVEEDRSLIELMSRYNGNMAIVADVLSSYSEVVSGNRRRRSIKQCCDHWFNSILKEHKNGPPAPTSSLTDADVLKQYFFGLVGAAAKSSKAFRLFDAKPMQPSDMHKSHARVTQDAKKPSANRIDPSMPPTYDVTDKRIAVPRSHIPGKKSYESTPHAVQKRKNPFLRPLSDSMPPIMSTNYFVREIRTNCPPVVPPSTRGATSRPPNRVPSSSASFASNYGRTQSAKHSSFEVGRIGNSANHTQSVQRGSLPQKFQKVSTSPVVLLGATSSQSNPPSRAQSSQRALMTAMPRRPPIRTSASVANGGHQPPPSHSSTGRQLPHTQTGHEAVTSAKLAANSVGAHRRITATAPTIRKTTFAGKIVDSVGINSGSTSVGSRLGEKKPEVQTTQSSSIKLQPRSTTFQGNVTISDNVPAKTEHRKVLNRTVSDIVSLPNTSNPDLGTVGSIPQSSGNSSQVPQKRTITMTNPNPGNSQVMSGVHKKNIDPSLQASVAQSTIISPNSDPTNKRENGLPQLQQQKQIRAPTILVEKSKGPKAHPQ